MSRWHHARAPWKRSRYHGRRMSEAKYLALPPVKPWLQYLDGVVVQKCTGDRVHSRLVVRLAMALGEFTRVHGGDATLSLRSLDEQRRNYRISDAGYLQPGAPRGDDVMVTLAVEVRSPDETVAGQRRQCEGWIEAGVAEAWLVEPRTRTVEVFGADGERRTLGEHERLISTAVPGLEIELAALFKVLDR